MNQLAAMSGGRFVGAGDDHQEGIAMRGVTVDGHVFLTVETEDGQRFALNAPIGLELEAGIVRLTTDRAAPLMVVRSAALDYGLRQALRRLLAQCGHPAALSPLLPDSRSATGAPIDLPRGNPTASGLAARPGGS